MPCSKIPVMLYIGIAYLSQSRVLASDDVKSSPITCFHASRDSITSACAYGLIISLFTLNLLRHLRKLKTRYPVL